MHRIEKGKGKRNKFDGEIWRLKVKEVAMYRKKPSCKKAFSTSTSSDSVWSFRICMPSGTLALISKAAASSAPVKNCTIGTNDTEPRKLQQMRPRSGQPHVRAWSGLTCAVGRRSCHGIDIGRSNKVFKRHPKLCCKRKREDERLCPHRIWLSYVAKFARPVAPLSSLPSFTNFTYAMDDFVMLFGQDAKCCKTSLHSPIKSALPESGSNKP